MPTSYTSLLGLALPVTGELSGTWGDTVNDYITRYVDASVAGTQAISGSQTAVTLTVTNGTTLTQVGSGSSGSAQYAVINCTGNPAGLLTITAPASSRQYLIINATSTAQSVKIVGAGPTTGVTLVTGESAIVAWNGSDYVKVASSTADGVTTFSAGTTGFTPSTATSGAVTLAGTLATTNGGTGLTSFTANGVVYASSTSALTTGSALTFDGTSLGVGITPAAKLDVSGASGGIFYVRGTGDAYQEIAGGGRTPGTGSVLVGQGNSGEAYFWNRFNSYSAFGVNNTEQMRLTSTGLGIGTTSPTGWGRTVSVSNTSTDSGFTFEGSTRKWGIGGGFTDGALRIYDFTAATERMRITATGDVGIGTSSPSHRLVVSQSETTAYAASSGSVVEPAGGANTQILNTGSGGFASLRFASLSGSYAQGYLAFVNTGGSALGYFAFGQRSGSGYAEQMRLDSSGNLGLGVTPSAWGASYRALQVGSASSLYGIGANTIVGNNAYNDGTNSRYITSSQATLYAQNSSGQHIWYTAASGTAGNTISFTQAMTLDASGNLGLGTTSPSLASGMGIAVYNSTVGGAARIALKNGSTGDASGDGFQLVASGVDAYIEQRENGFLAFTTNNTERARITAAGFTQPVAYADTVSALGNTGTATTINLLNANVFTATLTGNCTFTLSNPIATGSSSFTLILTNDGTAGRTVAWAGGSFVFPGGAAALSRTTTANAVDVWVFFTPNGGTTWYGNIAMKDMKA